MRSRKCSQLDPAANTRSSAGRCWSFRHVAHRCSRPTLKPQWPGPAREVIPRGLRRFPRPSANRSHGTCDHSHFGIHVTWLLILSHIYTHSYVQTHTQSHICGHTHSHAKTCAYTCRLTQIHMNIKAWLPFPFTLVTLLLVLEGGAFSIAQTTSGTKPVQTVLKG